MDNATLAQIATLNDTMAAALNRVRTAGPGTVRFLGYPRGTLNALVRRGLLRRIERATMSAGRPMRDDVYALAEGV